jgi:hypothetical protein
MSSYAFLFWLIHLLERVSVSVLQTRRRLIPENLNSSVQFHVDSGKVSKAIP